MNPQDQPTDQSSKERPGLQPVQPPVAASAPQNIPTLPTPEPTTQPRENLYRAEDRNDAVFPSAPSLVQAIKSPADVSSQVGDEEIAWNASEFVEHEKSPEWYFAMVGISVVAMIVTFLITRDWFNAVIVAVAAVLFGVSAARPPRHLQYLISDHGVGVGRRFYVYTDFRSYSLLDEGPMHSIILMPLKRFMPPISLYFDPADEDRIAEVLAAHLPFAEHEHELTERLMRRIRF